MKITSNLNRQALLSPAPELPLSEKRKDVEIPVNHN